MSKAESFNADAKSEVIEIPSDSSSHYSDFSDDDEESDGAEDGPNGVSLEKGSHSTRQQPTPPDTTRSIASRSSGRFLEADQPALTLQEREDKDTSDAEPTSPTFGDLVRGNEVIDVPAQQPHQLNPSSTALARQQQLQSPTVTSLGTVLNQALRTDDNDLLNACLNGSHDIAVVRASIQRMDSALAGALLTKLAYRLHRRPGRAHSLMSWVQWTLVAHGGALGAQPDVIGKLADLNRVLEERARGLPSLLALKGKLDMLEAQMQLRRENRARRGGRGSGAEIESDEDEEDEGVVYVEGEEDDEHGGLPNGMATARRKDAEDDGGVPTVNGAGDDSSDSEEEDSEGDADEGNAAAEEESLDEDEVDFDDGGEESGEEDESDAEVAAPPAKVQKVTPSFSRRK